MPTSILKAFAVAAIILAPLHAAATPLAYALDTSKSEVGFVFTLNGAAARGTMPVTSAKIQIDPSALQRSSVDVTVDVRRARTGFIFATEALKGASVLNAKKFGTIRFVSTEIQLNGSGRLADGAKIDGLLTIRGITRPVTLNAALFRPAGSQPQDLSRLSVRLNGAVNRSAFGASGYADLVADAVRLDIEAWVKR